MTFRCNAVLVKITVALELLYYDYYHLNVMEKHFFLKMPSQRAYLFSRGRINEMFFFARREGITFSGKCPPTENVICLYNKLQPTHAYFLDPRTAG